MWNHASWSCKTWCKTSGFSVFFSVTCRSHSHSGGSLKVLCNIGSSAERGIWLHATVIRGHIHEPDSASTWRAPRPAEPPWCLCHPVISRLHKCVVRTHPDEGGKATEANSLPFPAIKSQANAHLYMLAKSPAEWQTAMPPRHDRLTEECLWTAADLLQKPVHFLFRWFVLVHLKNHRAASARTSMQKRQGDFWKSLLATMGEWRRRLWLISLTDVCKINQAVIDVDAAAAGHFH